MLRTLALILLAGCPPPPSFLIVEVQSAHQPVRDALAGAYCAGAPRDDKPGTTLGWAMRTDEVGRARLLFGIAHPQNWCSVIVAKPGFRTAETSRLTTCTSAASCSPVRVELVPVGAPGSPPAEIAR